MENKDITFQVYHQPITNIRPEKYISLNQFLDYTKYPSKHIVKVFDQIADAEQTGNIKLKAKLKQTYLYYFTPCVQVYPIRNYDSIIYFNGLLVLDFDHIDNAEDFKQFLFNNYKSIIATWLSPSKHGVKCLVSIPKVSTIDKFKEYYFGIATEMEVYNGFDYSGQNAVLPLFQSYDPRLLFRDDFDTWTIKGIKLSDFTTAIEQQPPDNYISDKDKQTVIKIINTGFNNITDFGHPPLRSLCIAIGGYISAGYITETNALQIINKKIENHSYLKKGISGYKKTAYWAIMTGKRKPIYLSHGEK
jgi:hypothetical protein